MAAFGGCWPLDWFLFCWWLKEFWCIGVIGVAGVGVGGCASASEAGVAPVWLAAPPFLFACDLLVQV